MYATTPNQPMEQAMYSSSTIEKMHSITRQYSANKSARMERQREEKAIARKTYKHRNMRREMKWEACPE